MKNHANHHPITPNYVVLKYVLCTFVVGIVSQQYVMMKMINIIMYSPATTTAMTVAEVAKVAMIQWRPQRSRRRFRHRHTLRA